MAKSTVQKAQGMNNDSEIYWDKPFNEDPSIREGEEAMARVNRQFFYQIFPFYPPMMIIYKFKKNASFPLVPPKIRGWMNENVTELTFGQGGSE